MVSGALERTRIWSIVASMIESEADIVAVRQRARRLAELLCFETQDQTRIATAVSELARNAFAYARGGRAEFLLDPTPKPQIFIISISDQGGGIKNLDDILDGIYQSPHGMGVGLSGARRLMDEFNIDSQPGRGTTVRIGQRLPPRAGRIARVRLSEIAGILQRENALDPISALRDQNRELMQSLQEISRREEESRELNQELADTNRGVVALYAELDERAEQLRKASELKTRFLSNMSHEFRTPLNSVLALSRLLLDHVDGDLNGEQERQVTYIRRSAESLLELVNDLLDLAKVEAGKADVKPSPFQVSDLFSGLRGALKPLLTTASVDLIFDAADDLPTLFTDEGKVTQILRNLISNALKFTEVGEVRVVARADEKSRRINFSVRDSGIGIPPEHQHRIFEEFTQVESRLNTAVKGTGLGLPLSKSLAHLLGGELGVESIVGQGSVFTLSIPADIAPPPIPAHQRTRKDSRLALLIDDDETFRYVMRQIIGHAPAYTFREASDGEEGLRLALELQPDVIILDLQMPKVDGFECLKQLQANSQTRDIPVIVSTSIAVDEELRAKLPAGIRIVAKNSISRENVAQFLHEASQADL